MKSELQDQANEVMDLAVYLQFVGSFDTSLDFSTAKQISIDTYDFLKSASETELRTKLPELKHNLEKMVKPATERFPPKTALSAIASSWNDLFKKDKGFFSYGVEYGWVHQFMGLHNLGLYKQYVPYTLKIGLGANKGHFSIEEDFLLKDSFSFLLNCILSKSTLDKYADRVKKSGLFEDEKFTREIYTNFSSLKFDIASNARTSVVSFYSFVECFVNSVGYSYLQYNFEHLDEKSRELLLGKVNNKYISLKEKTKQFPSVIRANRPNNVEYERRRFDSQDQRFFQVYEQLRNSSVHYSPMKEDIWLKPELWLEKAKDFSELALVIAKRFWEDCFSFSEGPEYLEKLDYMRLYEAAKETLATRKAIESSNYLVEGKFS